MTHTPHEFSADFPEFAVKISELKQSDPEFVELYDEYHRVNRAVHRAETSVEPVGEVAETDLRKQRGQLKDQLYQIVSAA